MKNLLQRPGPQLMQDVSKALAATARAFPIPNSHKGDLPFAVRDLSRLLTAERSDIGRSYWSAPRFVSAYLRYFLPWNLYRLAWLLPGLDCITASAAGEEPRKVLDLGSGPLTLPLALWLARPDLRSTPLHITCADVASKPMEIGLAAFRSLAGKDSPWKVRLLRGHLDGILAKSRERHDCIMAGNVLNELQTGKGESLEERLHALIALMSRKLSPGGRLLLIEPGTRLGGKLVALARNGALAQGMRILAPCTHQGPCPALEQPAYYAMSPEYTSWCHFVSPAVDIPPALAELSKRAHLEKDGLAVSCMLLEKPLNGAEANSTISGSMQADAEGFAGMEFPDELDELEALYQEIMEEDESGNGTFLRNTDTGKRGHGVSDLNAVERATPGHAESGRTAFGGTGQDRGASGRGSSVAQKGGAVKRDNAAKNISGGNDLRQPEDEDIVRIISHPIRLPEQENSARYACSARGLALVLDAHTLPSGAAVRVDFSPKAERDRKSGALLATWRRRK